MGFYNILGYPATTSYVKEYGTEAQSGRNELRFQHGVLRATFCSSGRACWGCLTSEKVVARQNALTCSSLSGRCEPHTITWEKAEARGRDCRFDGDYRPK